MWVKTANWLGHQALINLDKFKIVTIEVIGNVGRIRAYLNEDENYLLGEYRDYAARRIFEDISLLIGQDKTYFMPEEDWANEKYKEEDT